MSPVPKDWYPGETIAWVAVSIEDPAVFKERARLAAQRLGPLCIEALPGYFHNSPAKPAEAALRFTGFGKWMAACQFACFEILYHFREAALPLLRRVAFGSYDWTQANATEILCRFALEGITPDVIEQEIARSVGDWRYEAILYAIHPLTRLAVVSDPVMKALDDLITEWGAIDPIEALELLEPLAQNAPVRARRYEALLRTVMVSDGRGTRSPLLDGQVVSAEGGALLAAASGPTYPTLPDYHAIRAGLVLHRLYPEDRGIILRLSHWAANHPDDQVRLELKEVLGNPSRESFAPLDPRILYPAVLGIAWEWTPEQCLAALPVPPWKIDESAMLLRIADREDDRLVCLDFTSPTEVLQLQAIRVSLYAAAEFSPSDFLDERTDPLPDDEEFRQTVEREYEAELRDARDYYEQARNRYLEILGPPSFRQDTAEDDRPIRHRRAMIEWREPTVDVALSLETTAAGKWPLDIVCLRLGMPEQPVRPDAQ